MESLLETELANRVKQKQVYVDRWQNYELLDRFGVTDRFEQLDFATVLENQRIFNDGNSDATFNRVSIPLVVRIWKNLNIGKWGSIQPMFYPADTMYSLIREYNNTTMDKVDIVAGSRKYRAVWSIGTDSLNINTEAELCSVLSYEIARDIDRHAVSYMTKYAGLNWTWDFNAAPGETLREKYGDLSSVILNFADEIGKNANRSPANWLITSPEICDMLCIGYNFEPSSGDGLFFGTLNETIKVYRDPLAPTSTILLGYKGNHPYDCGYHYCPYVMVGQTPDSFAPRRGLYGREAAGFFVRDGEKFYGTLSVLNFVI